ncbi:MAG: transcription termination/antitermination protein NusA [Bacilli bacterium]|nr:transcription termination/antitermination protein NusA [Bacilli bacterium]
MISKDFFKALELIALERGLEKEKILEIMERGILNAYKKVYNTSENAKIEFNEEKNEILLSADYLVVQEPENPGEVSLKDAKKRRKSSKIGDMITIKESPKDFGRIAASSAKQILTQGLKQLEREKAFELFKERENEMINTEIVALNKDFITLDLGQNLETSLPRKELLRSDDSRVGSRLKVYITKVEMTTKGPKVFVSRTDKNLVKRLIEQVCPEIHDGTVEIMGIARDAGDRCKVAVYSHDANVDPVGSVVGYKGSRITEVLEALQGEKIDIYEWSKDPMVLIQNSLEPAKIIAINPDKKKKQAIVIVKDKDLTAAIGNKGQNAKLAAQSCGWKIEIKSITQAKDEGIKYRRLDNAEA